MSDPNCEGIIPSGETGLAPGKEESFTCSHVLGNAGSYSNEATLEGNEGSGSKTSNKVVVKITAKPSFTIEKQQRLAGEIAYTTSEVTGELNQTVEYKVVVANTGNSTIKFGALKDAKCEGITPSGETELAPGKEESFTCSHVLTSVGPYTNEASIKGNEEKTSNKVTANVPPEPAFTIEKLERITGEPTYTAAEHSGKVGQVVEYEVIVKNTGNVSLTFGSLSDSNCESIKGGPAKALAPGESATYTCVHTLSGAGTYTNTASVEATPPPEDGFPVSHTSNTVVVKVAVGTVVHD